MKIISTLPDFHQNSLSAWIQSPPDLYPFSEGLTSIEANIEANHAFNFMLWQAEDRARCEDQGVDFVYQAKRDIDRFNQARNNQMEAIDISLFDSLHPASLESGCPIHSETPGMMIDRLSILSLKCFYMQIQTERDDVDESHKMQCRQKLERLSLQRQILHRCLLDLLEEVVSKKRTFVVYRQFKMYNDPIYRVSQLRG